VARAGIAELDEEVQRTQARLATLEAELALAPDTIKPADRVQGVFLRASLAQLERRRSEAEQQQAALDLALAAEEKQAGTRVHLAGLQAETGVVRTQATWLRRKATLSGVGGLVLALLLVGAFNPRLYDVDDIRRAGGLAWGTLHVPRTPGGRAC
jgi:chromosome segregation ATPase